MRRRVAHNGPSGAFVTYCNISCVISELLSLPHSSCKSKQQNRFAIVSQNNKIGSLFVPVSQNNKIGHIEYGFILVLILISMFLR